MKKIKPQKAPKKAQKKTKPMPTQKHGAATEAQTFLIKKTDKLEKK